MKIPMSPCVSVIERVSVPDWPGTVETIVTVIESANAGEAQNSTAATNMYFSIFQTPRQIPETISLATKFVAVPVERATFVITIAVVV